MATRSNLTDEELEDFFSIMLAKVIRARDARRNFSLDTERESIDITMFQDTSNRYMIGEYVTYTIRIHDPI